jgi:Uma2 family endonuclease
MGAPLTLPRHKLSIEDFHQMSRAGILREDSRVELIEGELIDMAPIGSRHASVVSTLSMLFARQVGELVIVSTQNRLSLPPDNEPQPDIAILKPSLDRYRNALPAAEDVLLLIEVADTSVEYDREIKLPLYARHSIPEVWFIDLNRGVLEIHLEPTNKGYRKLLTPDNRETIAPTLVEEVRLALSEIWPA